MALGGIFDADNKPHMCKQTAMFWFLSDAKGKLITQRRDRHTGELVNGDGVLAKLRLKGPKGYVRDSVRVEDYLEFLKRLWLYATKY